MKYHEATACFTLTNSDFNQVNLNCSTFCGSKSYPSNKVTVNDLSSVMKNAEVNVVLEFLGLLELGVCSLLLDHLLHKALVGGFREPALFIQESQDAWRTSLWGLVPESKRISHTNLLIAAGIRPDTTGPSSFPG